MRQEIAFNAQKVTLRKWLYLPDRTAGPVPTVVMAHGFSAVKEMYLDAFADVFVQARFGAPVFDNRDLPSAHRGCEGVLGLYRRDAGPI